MDWVGKQELEGAVILQQNKAMEEILELEGEGF